MSHTPPCKATPCCQDDPVLQCSSLVVGYGGEALLPPIDFRLCHKQLCAVVGRNGAGKTTLFRTILGLQSPVAGTMTGCKASLPMAYIPQRARFDPIVPLRASDVVAMGLERGRSFMSPWPGRAARRQVDWALGELGAADLAGRPFRELSEGQKQRVLMARLLAGRPELAVLDEPTAAMDEVAERQTMELIRDLCTTHELAVLIVSHHLPVVSRYADQVVFLDREHQHVVTGRPGEVFGHEAFRARYGEVSREP